MIKYEHRVYNITEDDIIYGKYSTKELIDIIWYSIDVYDGEVPYEKEAKKLSQSQRGVSAVMWYDLEVSENGHYKFFNESSGTVWKDAISGLKLIGAYKCATILENAVEKFNSNESFFNESFAKEDKEYIENCGEIESLIESYIMSHPSEFVFSGEVDMPVVEERSE